MISSNAWTISSHEFVSTPPNQSGMVAKDELMSLENVLGKKQVSERCLEVAFMFSCGV